MEILSNKPMYLISGGTEYKCTWRYTDGGYTLFQLSAATFTKSIFGGLKKSWKAVYESDTDACKSATRATYQQMEKWYLETIKEYESYKDSWQGGEK